MYAGSVLAGHMRNHSEYYDYLVVNDEIDKCVELVDDIIKNDGLSHKNDNHRISSNIDFIKEMKNELLSFSKGE